VKDYYSGVEKRDNPGRRNVLGRAPLFRWQISDVRIWLEAYFLVSGTGLGDRVGSAGVFFRSVWLWGVAAIAVPVVFGQAQGQLEAIHAEGIKTYPERSVVALTGLHVSMLSIKTR
jgi:hypothetical protein